MKKIFLGVAILAVLFPVVTIVTFKGTAFDHYPTQNEAANKVRHMLELKCLSCHSPQAKAPWYAAFPVAKQLIRRDMARGTSLFDLEKVMNPPAGEEVNEADLAKLEYGITGADMPPPQFLAVHWNAFLSVKEKADVLSFVREIRKRAYATGLSSAENADLMVQPLPAGLNTNPAKVSLGKILYHDTRLSGDNTVSCASCHDLAKGGTDQKKVSTGIRNQQGPINAPTVFNAAYHFVQFWDGRAKDLKEQAGGPVTNPLEMGAAWPDVLAKLAKDKNFKKLFVSVYPAGLTSDNVQDAIAEFEKTLTTPDTRFDAYLKGDKKALSANEEHGFRLFMKKGCATCHVGKNFGGQSYEKMGTRRDYFAERGSLTEADNGRFNVTKLEKDRYYFKVPTLRNIENTFPYFHDGSVSDLKEAVKIMARVQTEDSVTDKEADDLVSFLKTLTAKVDEVKKQ